MAHVVVVGADRGIAAGLVTEYRKRGERVTAVCLGDGSEWTGTDASVIARTDVTRDESVRAMAKQLEGETIDILVHVAGVGAFDRFGKFDFDAMLAHYNLNALGPLRVVSALEANLGAGAKVGIVTSRMGSIADNQSGSMYSYRMSKAAANMLGMTLYRDFRERQVYVMLLHPGTVATAMTEGARDWDAFTKPDESAAGLARQLDRLGPETPPEFRHQDGTLLPW